MPRPHRAGPRGARVIATASAKKAERIRDYGASEVLDYRLARLVREIIGGGAPKAVNAARGHAATTTLKAVADHGGSPPSPATRRGRNAASPCPMFSRLARWSATVGPRGGARPRHP